MEYLGRHPELKNVYGWALFWTWTQVHAKLCPVRAWEPRIMNHTSRWGIIKLLLTQAQVFVPPSHCSTFRWHWVPPLVLLNLLEVMWACPWYASVISGNTGSSGVTSSATRKWHIGRQNACITTRYCWACYSEVVQTNSVWAHFLACGSAQVWFGGHELWIEHNCFSLCPSLKMSIWFVYRIENEFIKLASSLLNNILIFYLKYLFLFI